ncbi:MAG: hypothetical protein JRI66_13585 [Deltaproteobacteria bacterium]|nr:hypothetical protein [Deltaproteobacteria bacterium]
MSDKYRWSIQLSFLWTVVLAIAVGAGFPACAQNMSELTYGQGVQDGIYAAAIDSVEPGVTNMFWGVLLGPFYLGYVVMTEPTIPPAILATLENKPEEYKRGFIAGYRRVMQHARLVGALSGGAIQALAIFFILQLSG